MKWLRPLLRSELSGRLFAFLASLYIRFVFFTCKWKTLGKEIPESYIQANKPFIVCFWHSRLSMLACAWTWKDRPFHMLMSTHRDGLLIARTVSHFGITWIAGSTQRGGTEALRGLIKTLRNGETIGITPDGPRGPSQVASMGVVTLAKLAKVDMVPITFSTSRRRLLNSWDRFHLPLPFGRGLFIWGDPISPPTRSDEVEMEKIRQQLETEMTHLQNKADELMGVDKSE
jgi:lysophospholipid acyltransferase (LPLAT)-like uncharacterized protein